MTLPPVSLSADWRQTPTPRLCPSCRASSVSAPWAARTPGAPRRQTHCDTTWYSVTTAESSGFQSLTCSWSSPSSVTSGFWDTRLISSRERAASNVTLLLGASGAAARPRQKSTTACLPPGESESQLAEMPTDRASVSAARSFPSAALRGSLSSSSPNSRHASSSSPSASTHASTTVAGAASPISRNGSAVTADDGGAAFLSLKKSFSSATQSSSACWASSSFLNA